MIFGESKKEILNMAGKFASAKVEKLIRSAGAHRVSADAVDRLNEIRLY